MVVRTICALVLIASISACGRAAGERNEAQNKSAEPRTAANSSLPLSGPAFLKAASIAVLGTQAEKSETLARTQYKTEAVRTIETPFGQVLVTDSSLLNAPYEGEASQGAIGFAYLRQDGSKIAVKNRWPLFVTGGINGNSPYGVEPEDRLTGYPAVAVKDVYPLQGYQCEWMTLVELMPDGPKNRGTIYLHADNKGTGDEPVYDRTGRITNIVRDKSFNVVVPGTQIREHYQMIKGRFVGPEESELRC